MAAARGTTSTGHSAARMRARETLPSSTPPNGPWPREPQTRTSSPFELSSASRCTRVAVLEHGKRPQAVRKLLDGVVQLLGEDVGRRRRDGHRGSERAGVRRRAGGSTPMTRIDACARSARPRASASAARDSGRPSKATPITRNGCGSAPQPVGTTTTGNRDSWISRSATPPRTRPAAWRWPWAPTTMSSAPASRACSPSSRGTEPPGSTRATTSSPSMSAASAVANAIASAPPAQPSSPARIGPLSAALRVMPRRAPGRRRAGRARRAASSSPTRCRTRRRP